MKKTTYSVVLTPSIKEALDVAAKKDRRSMSSLLEKIIVDYLEKEGISWEDNEAPRRGRPPKKSTRNK